MKNQQRLGTASCLDVVQQVFAMMDEAFLNHVRPG
jgi:hypothetical protein